MSTNTNNEPSKFTRFLRNHAALLLLIFSVIAIATVVLAVTLSGDSLPDAPVDVKPNPDVDNPDDKPAPTEPEKVFVKVLSVLLNTNSTSLPSEYSMPTD